MADLTPSSTQGSGATGQAQEKAQELAGQAQDKAQEVAGQAKSTLRDQADQRSTKAGEQINSTAGDVRSVGEELRKQGKDGPAKLADQAAERAERLGSYLTNADGDTLLHDLEDLGRKNPWAVMLGGLAVGFAASRVLRAQSSERYQTRASGQGLSQLPPRRPTPSPSYGAGPPVGGLGTGAPHTGAGLGQGPSVPVTGGV